MAFCPFNNPPGGNGIINTHRLDFALVSQCRIHSAHYLLPTAAPDMLG